MTPHQIITATLAQVPAASYPQLAEIILNTLEANGFKVVQTAEYDALTDAAVSASAPEGAA